MEVHGIYRDYGRALEHKVWNVSIKDLRRELAEIRVFSGKLTQLWTDDCNISSLLPPLTWHDRNICFSFASPFNPVLWGRVYLELVL
jgi:hypothetical protein